MPDPVAPHTATISPASTSRSTPVSTSSSSAYAKCAFWKLIGCGPAGAGKGWAGSGRRSMPSIQAKLRPAEASARWAGS